MRPASLRPVARIACAFRAAPVIALAWVVAVGPSATRAADPIDDSAPRATLMRIHGSDTIGASLIGELLLPFLQTEGWSDLNRLPVDGKTSYNIVGHSAPAGKLAGVYVEISDPESALLALDQGFADLAMCSRRARSAEVQQFSRLGDLTSPACEHVLALDAVAVIVNPANPVESLTRAQLKDIYLHQVTSWQEFGGSGPIHLYARDAKSGTHATFQTTILEGDDLPASLPRQPDNHSLSDAIALDPRGIGLVGETFAGGNRVIGISDGKLQPRVTRPSAATIRDGEYPMSRPLYLYTAAASDNALVGRFLAFALGPAGQAIVTTCGFISPVIEPTPPASPEPVAAPPPAPPPPVAVARPSPPPAPIDDPPERVRRVRPQPAPTPRPARVVTPRPAARPSIPSIPSTPSIPTAPTDSPPAFGAGG